MGKQHMMFMCFGAARNMFCLECLRKVSLSYAHTRPEPRDASVEAAGEDALPGHERCVSGSEKMWQRLLFDTTQDTVVVER